MDTSALKTAYVALRDFLSAQQLYDDAPTGVFDRAQLARLFTAYYDAEAETLRVASETRTDLTAGSVLEDVAKNLGYENGYTQMKNGVTIIENGKIRTDLIDVENLEARRVRVSDASGCAVTIKTNEGLRLLDKNEQVTAVFTGDKMLSLSQKVPLSRNVMLDEAFQTSNQKNLATKTVSLASGQIEVGDTKITVEIPALTVSFYATYSERAPDQEQGEWKPIIRPDLPLDKAELRPGPDVDPLFDEQNINPPTGDQIINPGGGGLVIDPGDIIDKPISIDVPNPNPMTLRVELRVNGVTRASVYHCIDKFRREAKITGYDNQPEWWYEVRESRSDTFKGLSIEYAASGPLTVEMRYSISSPSPNLNNNSWQFQFGARKSGNYIDKMPLERIPIMVGAKVFNASFFGNGLLFSQSTRQFAGLAVPDSGEAELMVRSDKNGFRADVGGQWRWCDKRQEWIPADRVLYRGYFDYGGKMVRSWTYDSTKGKPISSRFNLGLYNVTLPNTTLRPYTDFIVRLDAWTLVNDDRRFATAYYGDNRHMFNVSLSNGGYHDGYLYFEVVDVSDMTA